MELGPLQKEWVDALREHPEQQTEGILGQYPIDKYCCLGKLCMIDALKSDTKLTVVVRDSFLYFDSQNAWLPQSIVNKYYFYDEVGTLADKINSFYDNEDFKEKHLKIYKNVFSNFPKIENANLASLNDQGVTWLEIANFIETHPELIFKDSI